MIWAMIVPAAPVAMAKDMSTYNDVNLYEDVAAAVARGKSYYQTVADLHRAHGYPLQPFYVVRLPTMAWLAALLGWPALRAIAMLLLVGGGLTWFAALRSLHTRAEQLAALTFAVMLGGGAVASEQLISMHEGWVGLLLFPALPLLWRWPNRWPVALLLAAMALALRELALPFVLLAGAYALVRRDWKQAAAWGLLVGLFAVGMALHRAQVLGVTQPGDMASTGWSAMGGLSQLASSVTLSSSLQLLPVPLARMAALLPLLGWLALRGPRALLVWLWFVGMALAIALFARPDNVYWGFAVMPGYMIGLALVPRLMADLWHGFAGKPDAKKIVT
jgi:hypothetical protein